MLVFSPDGSGIPSRFFYEMEYSGQQEPIFPDNAYSFAPPVFLSNIPNFSKT
jgi:hypothetical protein